MFFSAFFRKKMIRSIAMVCLLSMLFQLVFPVAAVALTSGPSQPEMQSFEPVGTTDMVDLFSGDFNYNIPLLEVEGYPINIAYHSGVTMEQEASWVGLGWNINPGNINHIVRGVSDDFKGDEIEKTLDITPEVNKRFGMFMGVEFAGWKTEGLGEAAKKAMKNLAGVSASSQLDFGINFSNYNGVSASMGKSNSFGYSTPWISAGVNLGSVVSTDQGTDFDYSFSTGVNINKKVNATMNFSVGGGMNSNEGLKYTSYGVNPQMTPNGGLSNMMVPIGLQNYVPVITNASMAKSLFFQIQVGGEIYMMYPYGGASYAQSEVHFARNGNRDAYGYFYMDDAISSDIVDFTRDKDGRINKKSAYLPMPSMTYDIYSVSGQGTGGTFRPFRNDIGTVHDPLLGTEAHDVKAVGEIGIGNLLEVGVDTRYSYNQAKSGPWDQHQKSFNKKVKGELYEPFYFKQAGELTDANSGFNNAIQNREALLYTKASSLIGQSPYDPMSKPRVPRGNLLYFLSADEASSPQASLLPKLENYSSNGSVLHLDRYNTNATTGYRKKHHASEFTQLLPDGRRYIYGLPVMNKWQRDYEVSYELASGSAGSNPYSVQLSYASHKPQPGNSIHYSSRTETPAYAHSYLLTSIISADYSDLTGDGISDDDLGSYTKFNYTYKDDYYWRAPFNAKSAQFNRGVKSDCKDDKANFSAGCRENWMLHSIESRNYIARFFTSERKDGRGTNDYDLEGIGSLTNPPSYSYKLDSIVLYNKRELIADPSTAVPVKAIVFSYDYSLCGSLPAPNTSSGKLTLKGIYIRNGNSDIGFLSPYKFAYGSSTSGPSNYNNPSYDPIAKDCWGNYKPADCNSDPSKNLGLDHSNTEFPYVNQNDPNLNTYASAWNLREVFLPSGGSIKITYEADDYAFVQDKHAMEMYKVAGVGPTSDYIANSSLYQDASDPYLYIYFKRKATDENYPDNISKSYLGEENLIQYNFDVEISPGAMPSCAGTPIHNSVKGYARVLESGICNNPDYGYVKLEPKIPRSMFNSTGTKVNPITLAAINFSRYYHNKALRPSSDIQSADQALIRELMSSMGTMVNFFENPIKTFIKQNKAKNFTPNKSYIRLVSQGLKKKGGGHRVKRLEFKDTWDGTSAAATYGSNYDYTVFDDITGKKVSSGVASYEPLYGGDENPNRTLLNIEETGNKSNFPPTDPIELLQEGPLGESLYPPAVVGYSRVTVSSIHKDVGESSQAIKEFEFYTAKDFPIKVTATGLQKIEERMPKLFDLFNKKETYRVAQGYSLSLNDMHGKVKKQSTWVARYDPTDQTNPEDRELVSYTKYEYFKNSNGTLSNDVPCLEFQSNVAEPVLVTKTLGVETDLTVDTRQKEEVSNFFTLMFNSSAFLAGYIPVYVPTIFPTFKKHTKTFSSLVNSKITQQYGIIQSVESYDKGAIVKVENQAFDPKTGQVLITRVNTEHSDHEYNVKYPAYWAYKCMGPAYENIHYEENLANKVFVQDGTCYIATPHPERYNIGDELLLKINNTCDVQYAITGQTTNFKLWVTGKTLQQMPSEAMPCPCVNSSFNQEPLVYSNSIECTKPDPAFEHFTCSSLNSLIAYLGARTHDADLTLANIAHTIEKVDITYNFPDGCNAGGIASFNPFFGSGAVFQYFLGIPAIGHMHSGMPHGAYKHESYKAYKTTNFNPANPSPFSSSHYSLITYEINAEEKISYSDNAPGSPPTPATNESINTWDDHNDCVKDGKNPPYVRVDIYIARDANSATNSPLYSNANLPDFEPPSVLLRERDGPPPLNTYHEEFRTQYKEHIKRTVSHGQRGTPQAVLTLETKPIKKSVNSDYQSPVSIAFNSLGFVPNASIKVIRSGKRNQLNETVQDLLATNDPIMNNHLATSYSAINSSVTTYTNGALVPADLKSPNADYHNPFVTGELGNYRPVATYMPHKLRSYTSTVAVLNSFNADRHRGLYDVASYWYFPTALNQEFYHKMMPDLSSASTWQPKSTVTAYSPWGVDLEVKDATDNRHANIMGYGHRLPMAVVSNCEYNDALCENFEDFAELFSQSVVQYTNSNFKHSIKSQFTNIPGLSGNTFDIINSGHTGAKALLVKTPFSIPIAIGDFAIMPGQLTSFYFRPTRKYVVSCWEYVGNVSSQPPAISRLRVGMTGIPGTLQAKTPVIDGWVLYEGEVTFPSSPNLQQTVNIHSFHSNFTIDDFRIMPAASNMKSYVYHPTNRRLVATLDENHMATFFEYSPEGKLVRVKKETEKGILTLKESRESLKNVFINPDGSVGYPDLPNQ